MIKLDFNSKCVKARVDEILAMLEKQPMTVREIAESVGLSSSAIRPYIGHLRDSRALVRCAVKDRANVYKTTGKYLPPEDCIDMPWEKKVSNVKLFRDALCIAFYGPYQCEPPPARTAQ